MRGRLAVKKRTAAWRYSVARYQRVRFWARIRGGSSPHPTRGREKRVVSVMAGAQNTIKQHHPAHRRLPAWRPVPQPVVRIRWQHRFPGIICC